MKNLLVSTWLALVITDCTIGYIWIGNAFKHEANPLVRLLVQGMGANAFIALAILATLIAGYGLVAKAKWLSYIFASLTALEIYPIIKGFYYLSVWEGL